MRQKIGYPAHWKDYTSLQIVPDNFIADLHAAQVLNPSEVLSCIGEPVDEGRFYWTVPEADGNYNES